MQGLGDLQYGQVGCSQAAFGLDQCRFVEPFECGMSRGLLDGGREPFGGDAEPVGIEGDLPLRLEVLRLLKPFHSHLPVYRYEPDKGSCRV